MANKKYKIKNNTKGLLTIIDPITGANYTLINNKISKEFTEEQLNDFYGAYPRLFEEGYVIPLDKAVYGLIGVDEDIQKRIMSVEEIEKMIDKCDVNEIEEALDRVTDVVAENIAEVASEKNIDSQKVAKQIKKKTGKDIITAKEEE